MRNTCLPTFLVVLTISILSLSLSEPTPSASPQEVPDCVKIALEIVKSAPLVKEIASEVQDEKHRTSFLLEDRVSGANSAGGQDSKYVFKIGINGPEWFETIATFCFYPQKGMLTETNWLTGEEQILFFDKSLLEKLPDSCR